MVYEIPQQLEHKEKIIFGLTFVQLGWAVLFGSIVLIILTRKGSIATNIIIAFFPALLGVIFVFFDVSTWFKRLSHFFSFRSATLSSPKMQKFIGIKKIENSIIQADKDIAILHIVPINFGIRADADKESVIYGFQKFLNSLDFPIQFVVTTTNVNLDAYLDTLGKRVRDK